MHFDVDLNKRKWMKNGKKGGTKDKIKRGKRTRIVERWSVIDKQHVGTKGKDMGFLKHARFPTLDYKELLEVFVCRPSHEDCQQDASISGCHRSGCVLKEQLSLDGFLIITQKDPRDIW